MESLKLYEIEPEYIDYISAFAPHLFHNKKSGQSHDRKYIGVILHINGFDYFAPLSSFKTKHHSMKESIDFIKIKKYAVINLNNMFPAPLHICKYIIISTQRDKKYRDLLLAEYRFIKSIQDKIRKNAQTLYHLKLKDGNSTSLSKRCNDFKVLEEACKKFKSN